MKLTDNFFVDIGNDSPYMKVGAEGEAGSGKTFTLALIAIGLHQRMQSEKPVVIFDTENSSRFLKSMFAKHGINVLVKPSRELADLTATMDWCNAGNSDVLLIDSATHIYENFLEAFKLKHGRKFIQFQDWGIIKPLWKREFSQRLVQGAYNILFTGRVGYTYEYQTNDDGKKELVKTGLKMKVEGETAYEPDLLLLMERFEQLIPEADKDKQVWHSCTVLKDRADLIDGKVFRDPSWDDFEPVYDFLSQELVERPECPEGDTSEMFEGPDNNAEVRRQRDILIEEIKAIFDRYEIGTSKEDKAAKVVISETAFGTASGSAFASMSIEELKHGKQLCAELCKQYRSDPLEFNKRREVAA